MKSKTKVPPFFSLRPKRLMHDITMWLYCDWASNIALPTTSLHYALPRV